jgi:hypothetical protein
LVASALVAACELQEISVTQGEDIVIVELILRADEAVQFAFLHRTLGTNSGAVPGAAIEVRNGDGEILSFHQVSEAQCVDFDGEQPANALGSCYQSNAGGMIIRPGSAYTLRVVLPEGGVMTGETVVPGAFTLVRPTASPCRLEPDTTLELSWTRADGAWVYLAETLLGGLREALRRRNVEISGRGPVRLLGLSVSGEDTTIVFPSEFGVFDRADDDLSDALVAIQKGLPPDVFGGIIVAAADRNYVNWVRGGNFNPSGPVRVPSVRGAGTGVFGSIVPRNQNLSTNSADNSPPCL